MKEQKRSNQKGFTIIELMIATTIFSLVLMICLAAIMNITRTYYQGTLQARTQNRVREIVDEIADEIRYRPGEIVQTTGMTALTDAPEQEDESVGSVDPTSPQSYVGQYCIGTVQYRYLLGFKADSEASPATSSDDDRIAARPLIRNSGAGACNPANDLDLTDSVDTTLEHITSSQEYGILDDNMRVLEFSIRRVGVEDKYMVAVTVAYGDDDLIGYENGRFICRPNNIARAYCATSRLEVIVSRRF